MEYQTARTRFDFDAVAVRGCCRWCSAPIASDRRKLYRLRAAKKALHFFGFLCYWAVALSIGFLAVLAIMALFVCLS